MTSIDSFRVDPDELRSGASDVLKCLTPARGADFSTLNDDFDGTDQGDKILADKFESFCNTWDVAHRVLDDRSEDVSDKLKREADTYEFNEAHIGEYMKYVDQHKDGSGL
ncbi:hypothetical protein ACFV3R_13905 [Streptomyces sp. NPDC059740]|uniref:hypothetical protein n=1 Tax=Streptomyces sp. NPDC059740 TaxID=3346926 RepID=UPI003665A053